MAERVTIWRRAYRRQVLLNQLAIMAGLKEHMTLQHGQRFAADSAKRFDDAIKASVELLKSVDDDE